MRFIIVFHLLFSAISCYSQKTELPESAISIGFGAGQPSGGFGIKTVLGGKNSGLLLGLGSYGGGITGYTIGLQAASKSIYFNFNYGLVGTHQINNGPIQPTKAASLLAGAMIDLGPKKITFLDLGIGFSFGAKKVNLVYHEVNNNVVCFNAGLGFRIPKN